MIEHEMITTAFELPGITITRSLGIVQGIALREHFLIAHTMAAKVEFCHRARVHAFESMAQIAETLGANAIIGVRYNTSIIMENYTEILAYGTAVVVEKEIK